MRVLKIFGGTLLAILVGLALLFGFARLQDGPIGMIPGGPLVAGENINEPVTNWKFIEPVEEVEMQLVDDDTSRTTWILVDQGQAYIPASLTFPPGKTWYRRADQRGDARVRTQGKIYSVDLVRETDEIVRDRLKASAREKYDVGPVFGDGVWFFRLSPRSS